MDGAIARFAMIAVVVAAGSAGCRSDRPASVPSQARFEAGGRPGEAHLLKFLPGEDGTIYVTDAWDNSLTYSGPVHRGDHVVVKRDEGQVLVNEQVVYDHPMRHTDHWIYFLPGPATPR